MSFGSIDQQAQAIQTMMDASHLPAFEGLTFFTFRGIWVMSDDFERLLEMRNKLSHGEQLVLDVARDYWTWQARVKLWDLTALSPHLIDLVLGLFVAFNHGPAVVDHWMAAQSSQGVQ